MADQQSFRTGPGSETCSSGSTIETTTATTTTTTTDETMRQPYALAKKMIALNHAGVQCLEGNNIVSAMKTFSSAYRTYERLRKSLLSMPATQSKEDTSTATISTSSSQRHAGARPPRRSLSATPIFQQHSSITHTVAVAGNPIVQSLDAMLLTAHRNSNDNDKDNANSDRPAAEGIFRAPIKLPNLENLPSSVFSSSQDQKQCTTSAFLTTCHVYNLALAQHLRGIELLEVASREDRRNKAVFGPTESRDNSGDEGSSSYFTSQARECLCRSGRLYEHVMRTEGARSGCPSEQPNKQRTHTHTHTQIGVLKVVLACLNNLGHLHGHTQNPVLARSCYNQVQRIIEKLETPGHHRLRHKQQHPDSSGNRHKDGGEHHRGAVSCLDFFWDMTSQSLLRLEATTRSAKTTRATPGGDVTTSRRRKHAADDEACESTVSAETSNSNQRRKRSKISEYYAPAA